MKNISLNTVPLVSHSAISNLGAGLDAISWTNPIIVVMIRLLLILSSFAYYFGFFLPEKMANWLIKA